MIGMPRSMMQEEMQPLGPAIKREAQEKMDESTGAGRSLSNRGQNVPVHFTSSLIPPEGELMSIDGGLWRVTGHNESGFFAVKESRSGGVIVGFHNCHAGDQVRCYGSAPGGGKSTLGADAKWVAEMMGKAIAEMAAYGLKPVTATEVARELPAWARDHVIRPGTICWAT